MSVYVIVETKVTNDAWMRSTAQKRLNSFKNMAASTSPVAHRLRISRGTRNSRMSLSFSSFLLRSKPGRGTTTRITGRSSS